MALHYSQNTLLFIYLFIWKKKEKKNKNKKKKKNTKQRNNVIDGIEPDKIPAILGLLYLLMSLSYFIVSGEISVYLVKIKVVSITSELISYHFTSNWYTIYIFTARFGRLRFSSLFQKWM